MIIGDSNMELLASTEIQKRYIQETYDLSNHITNATQELEKKLIDRIIFNIPGNIFMQIFYRVQKSMITTHPIL